MLFFLYFYWDILDISSFPSASLCGFIICHGHLAQAQVQALSDGDLMFARYISAGSISLLIREIIFFVPPFSYRVVAYIFVPNINLDSDGIVPSPFGSSSLLRQGPLFLGVFLATVLLGIVLCQGGTYFVRYCKRDPAWIPIMILVCSLTNAFQTVCLESYLYVIILKNWDVDILAGKDSKLVVINWLFSMAPASQGVVSTVVQCFFVWRINILTHLRSLVAFLVLCALISGCSNVYAASVCLRSGTLADLSGARYGSSAVADTLIAITLVTYMQKKRTGVSKIDNVLTRIIRLTVQTDVNAVLASLNAREHGVGTRSTEQQAHATPTTPITPPSPQSRMRNVGAVLPTPLNLVRKKSECERAWVVQVDATAQTHEQELVAEIAPRTQFREIHDGSPV
ncbi:hypothetical protein FISHEDRAFT_76461 [Fistulina hepatica ATCC 64428]|uniref:Uncharacterized protein n=1 Tax=Fistulina hepatica ATCC 64428 TaxID=1128425 RepID=A0A0D7A4F1_9AGAR|nr:hypothetical protein FISHEDRAFT_76461 [Fistulina hepatica ATCC 64428]